MELETRTKKPSVGVGGWVWGMDIFWNIEKLVSHRNSLLFKGNG